ncbi:hypothetical protein Tco_0038306 [Tanacetum coccineum]
MSPRSCLRWKPTGRILKTVGLRWVPIGKIFTSSTTTVDCEPPHGSNTDVTNLHKCIQTLDSSAGTSINVQEEQNLDLSAGTPSNLKKERIKACIKENMISGSPRVMLFSIHSDEWKSFQSQPQTALRGIQLKAMRLHSQDHTFEDHTLGESCFELDSPNALSWKPSQQQSNLKKFKEARFKISPQEFEGHTLGEIVSLKIYFLNIEAQNMQEASLRGRLLVPSCCVIFDLEPFLFDFDFNSEIIKSFPCLSCCLCHLAILCLYQHAHTMHYLESLLTISLDRLDILKEDLVYQSLRKSLSLNLELS